MKDIARLVIGDGFRNYFVFKVGNTLNNLMLVNKF